MTVLNIQGSGKFGGKLLIRGGRRDINENDWFTPLVIKDLNVSFLTFLLINVIIRYTSKKIFKKILGFCKIY